MQKITPFLWFDNNAEEAVNFYTSTFKDAEINEVVRYTEGGPMPAGTVLTMAFKLHGQEFVALNGGPTYRFTPAISFYVACESQAEVDYLWERFLEGGREEACGWLTDKFGVSWQIIPTALPELLNDPDPAKAQRVMTAMLGMKKIVVADLWAAHAGE